MKKVIKKLSLGLGVVASLALVSCGSEGGSADTTTPEAAQEQTEEAAPAAEEVPVAEEAATDGPNLGIGPITEVVLGEEIDQAMATAGEESFKAKCMICHQVDVKGIGPAQKNIMNRRSPEWIMNMMLNTTEMLEKDADAKALLAEYNNVPMTQTEMTEEEARNMLEYFRTISE